MRFYYRGVSYEHYPSQSESISQSAAQPVQVLCYRGVLHVRERQLLHLSRISDEVTHSSNNKSWHDKTQSEVKQGSHAARSQQIGFLYKLYCIGWQNGSLQSFSLLRHRLLSIFLLYRTGYTAGFKWRQHNLESHYYRTR